MWEAGEQTRKTLEKQLKSDLPFPKSCKEEVQEHRGAPTSLPVPGRVRAAPLSGCRAGGLPHRQWHRSMTRVRAPHGPKCSLPPLCPATKGLVLGILLSQSTLYGLNSYMAEP